MKERTIMGIVMMAVFLPVLIMQEMFILFQIMMIGLTLIASLELIKMYEKKKKFPGFSKWIIVICTLLIYFAATAEWCKTIDSVNRDVQLQATGETISFEILQILNINVGVLPMLTICMLLLFSLLVVYRDFDGADIGKAVTVMLYAGVGFAGLTCLRAVGLRFILYMFIITILTDVFAYLVGSKFGKHKMCPHISPKKSWEGSIGGTLIATIFGTLFAVFYGNIFGSIFGPVEAKTLLHYCPFINSNLISYLNNLEIVFLLFALTLFISICSQLGDLVASKLKRTYGIKDYGDLFPGHGGVLDRFDSALFAAMFILSAFMILAGVSTKIIGAVRL